MGRGSLRFGSQEELEEHLRRNARNNITVANPIKAAPKKRAQKYNAKPTVVAGTKFPSKLEGRYFAQLLMEWQSAQERQRKGCSQDGDLLWFGRQMKFDLEGGVIYIVDFVEGRLILDGWRSRTQFVDTKGELLQATKNKLKQVKERYGIDVELLRDEDVLSFSL